LLSFAVNDERLERNCPLASSETNIAAAFMNLIFQNHIMI
jgi:hypothetical protein